MLLDTQLRFLSTPAFRFVVTIGGRPLGAFTECSLPTLEIELEEVKEGGLNTYVHQLPGRRKSARLTLKNGVGVYSEIMIWYIQTLDEKYDRRRVSVALMNSVFMPMMVWDLEEAYPVKWSGPQLKSDDNTVAIQTLELAFGAFNMIPSAIPAF